MELRPVRSSERGQVLDLLAHWFDNREFFARYNLNDPSLRDELCLVAVDRGRLVSTVQIFDRKVNLAGRAIAMGGIGSVFTLPEYRKSGVASALMRLSVETMAREGFEVSLLFAERLDFYARFGWSSFTRTFSLIQNAHGIAPDDRFTLMPFDRARDLGEVAAIYASYSGRFDCTVVRDPDYWRGNLIYAGNPEEYFVLCRAGGGALAAYARAIRFYGFPMIMEYGYLPDAQPAMLATFRHLANSAAKLPKDFYLETAAVAAAPPELDPAQPLTPVTHTAHDPALERSLTAAGCSVVHHQDNYYMWRIISPERLGRSFDLAPAAAAAKVTAMVASSGSVFWTADRF
jgi:predicted N-acetyltransferase YhbS